VCTFLLFGKEEQTFCKISPPWKKERVNDDGNVKTVRIALSNEVPLVNII